MKIEKEKDGALHFRFIESEEGIDIGSVFSNVVVTTVVHDDCDRVVVGKAR